MGHPMGNLTPFERDVLAQALTDYGEGLGNDMDISQEDRDKADHALDNIERIILHNLPRRKEE